MELNVSAPARGTILVVEDNPDWGGLLRRGFEASGYSVLTCEDGTRALDVLRWHAPPDAIVLDLSLPGTSGEAILRSVRTDPELDWLPVVVVTGSDLPAEGADAIFRKPVLPSAVVNAVEQLAIRHDGP